MDFIRYCLPMLLFFVQGYCEQHMFTYRTNKTCGIDLRMNEAFEFKKTTDSAIGCVRMCSEYDGCDGTIFFKENKTCFGVNNDTVMIYGSDYCVSSGATHYKLVSAIHVPAANTTAGPADAGSASSAVFESTTGSTTESTTAVTTSDSTTSLADPADTGSASSAVSESTTVSTTDSTTAATSESTTSLGCVITTALVGPIDNEAQFSASSSSSSLYPPIGGKLGSTYGWHPATETVEEYIQIKPKLTSIIARFKTNIIQIRQRVKTLPIDPNIKIARLRQRHNDRGKFELDQVRFVTPKVLTAVATKGVRILGGILRWLESYKVSTSSNSDCSSFSALINSDGTELVFEGNSDDTTLVTNSINPPVVVHCVRINPIQWYTQIGLNFELYGCNY